MKKTFIFLALVVTGYWLPVVSVYAQAPNLLTYQGRLKESGQPFTGNKNIEIILCDSPTGGAVYTTGVQTVSISNGLFKSTFTVPSGVNVSSGTWYLEISVGGVALLPRERLTSLMYALYATTAAYANNLTASPGAPGIFVSTNFFVAAGNVGIGTAAPEQKFHVLESGATEPVIIEQVATPGGAPDINLRKAYGTPSAKTIIGNGELTGRVLGFGYDGSTYRRNAAISFVVDGVPSAGVMPGRILFGTRGTTGDIAERMRIDNNGNVGIGTTSPLEKLDVAGVIRSSSSIYPGDGSNFQSDRYIKDDAGKYGTVFSSNVYIVGFSSAAKYYGDGAGLTNLPAPANVATTDTSQVISGTKTFTGQLVLNSTLTVIAPTNAASSLWVSTSITTPHLYVSTTGNVGIGTTSPRSKLSVNGILSVSGGIYGGDGATEDGGGFWWIKKVAGIGDIQFNQYSGSSWIDTVRFKGDGNVGIGTTNPMATLHVYGDVAISTGSPSGGSHLRSFQPTPPTVAASADCGGLASASITGGTDMAGTVVLNTGNTPSPGATCMVTVTFVRSYASAPKAVVITPVGPNSSSLNASLSPVPTISAFFIKPNLIPAINTSYSWSYIVIE